MRSAGLRCALPTRRTAGARPPHAASLQPACSQGPVMSRAGRSGAGIITGSIAGHSRRVGIGMLSARRTVEPSWTACHTRVRVSQWYWQWTNLLVLLIVRINFRIGMYNSCKSNIVELNRHIRNRESTRCSCSNLCERCSNTIPAVTAELCTACNV